MWALGLGMTALSAMTGLVASYVKLSVLEERLLLPAASVAMLAPTLTATAPSTVGVTVSVYVLDETVLKLLPVTEPPVTEISPDVNPLTPSPNVTVTGIGEMLVAEDAEDDNVGVGGTESYVMRIVFDGFDTLVAKSCAAPESKLIITVPCAVGATVKV